ncbi:GNAT family N-acetyltransferase [Streptomyces sp. SID8366]|uniref:GNAT family N-acetyltransferase n=1 Tax=unclassified Streptomyces TaxID=2593676 RepID=UPI000DB9F4C8|nr:MULTISPECIES: GNAT family N-acetyltransferase [unclassified Streptomyces]MYU03641.1 GNAT family N-acetyltransferase [Streptomyces sp. SID8366]MYU66258.1 GNAT family N-acetyltransferase [Streptomyces sp. SID69]RAJ57703.1 putative N-acyltransferase [Streptomyces sp. PsTaAH-130]
MRRERGAPARRGEPSPARASYRIEIADTVDAVPPQVWRELAPADDPLWSQGVFAAMERGRLGPEGYRYLLLRRDGELVAVLPLCLFPGLRLDDVVGPRERRLLRPLRAVCPGLLRVPMLFCGHLLGQGHIAAAGPLPARAVRLLVSAAGDVAAWSGLGTVVFKDFGDSELAFLRPELERAGYFFTRSMPDTELRLGYDSFEAYVRALPAKPRRNARSKLRKFAAWPGARVEIVEDFAPLLPDVLALYEQVMDRADQTLDRLDASFLAALADSAEPRRALVAAFEGDRLVAFLLCLFRGTGATGARIGLDYRIAHEARLYHAVHYAAIRLAIESGCTHIRFAQTAYTPKVELGCGLVAQSYALTHRRPLPRALLRALLPRALDTALAEALGPHADLLPRPVAAPPPAPAAAPEKRTPHAPS